MTKLINLFLICILVTGCSVTQKPEPAQTATPEPTVETVVKYQIEDGYFMVERENEYWDDNGNFVHNHELSFDEFVRDYSASNGSNPNVLCESLEKNEDSYYDYVNNNGRIPKGTYYIEYEEYGADEGLADLKLEKAKNICPSTLDKVENYSE